MENPTVKVYTETPPELKRALESCLPNSLPLLQRLQFMNLPGGSTPDSKILLSSSNRNDGILLAVDQPFTAAYLDFSRGPETEMWIFSTLEMLDQDEKACEEQIIQLYKEVGSIEEKYPAKRETPGVICCGSVHERIVSVLRARDLYSSDSGAHTKFIFDVEETVVGERGLPGNEYRWGVIRAEDIPLVLSRTSIPRKERTVKLLPSLAVFIKESSVPVAWAFLGPDASLTSLHCEAPCRGKGIAKALATRIFKYQGIHFPGANWAHADVLTTNLQSQAVCKSINGKPGWTIYWTWVKISNML